MTLRADRDFMTAPTTLIQISLPGMNVLIKTPQQEKNQTLESYNYQPTPSLNQTS